MPAALPARTKALAQILFMQGLTAKAIGEKLNLLPVTVQNWSTRGQWLELRSNLHTELSRPVDALLARESRELRQGVARELFRVLNDVRSIPGGRKTAAQRTGLLESITRSAKTVLGWGESVNGKALDITALGSALSTLPTQGDAPALPPADTAKDDAPADTEAACESMLTTGEAPAPDQAPAPPLDGGGEDEIPLQKILGKMDEKSSVGEAINVEGGDDVLT